MPRLPRWQRRQRRLIGNGYEIHHRIEEGTTMSNDSDREEILTISPGELQASDFFPPGEGWNKQACDAEELKRKAAQCEPGHDDRVGTEGGRPH